MDYPTNVHIETTGRCNSRCTFCPHSISPRRNMDMQPALFNKILGDLKDIPQPFILTPFKLGEPMLDPFFSRRLLQIEQELPNALFEIHTNLNKLPKDLISSLRRLHNVKHLWISLNHYTKQSYKETTGLDFEKTVANIHKLLAANLPHKIMIGRVATYDIEDQKWKKWVEETFPSAPAVVMVRGDWCTHADFPLWANPTGACKRTWEVSICCDGRVALCCMDGLCEYPLGDVKTQHVLDVFNSPTAKTMRNMTHRLWKPCSTCTFM